MTNKQHSREDAGRLCSLAASTLYRLLSKRRFNLNFRLKSPLILL